MKGGRGCRLVAAREVGHRLPPAVLENLEVLCSEVSDKIAAARGHRRTDVDKIYTRAKRRLLPRDQHGRRGSERRRHHDCTFEHSDHLEKAILHLSAFASILAAGVYLGLSPRMAPVPSPTTVILV